MVGKSWFPGSSFCEVGVTIPALPTSEGVQWGRESSLFKICRTLLAEHLNQLLWYNNIYQLMFAHQSPRKLSWTVEETYNIWLFVIGTNYMQLTHAREGCVPCTPEKLAPRLQRPSHRTALLIPRSSKTPCCWCGCHFSLLHGVARLHHSCWHWHSSVKSSLSCF